MFSEGPLQYRNNFFLVFDAFRIEGKSDLLFVNLYINKARKFSEWQKFMDDNVELIDNINHALEHLSKCRLLQKEYTELVAEGQFQEARDFRVLHDIEMLQKTSWDRLNPLLEEASGIMSEYGIDGEEFEG
jgi:hypothetical protein